MINLREIRNAVVDYINSRVKATCTISPLPGQNVIGPGEKFNIEVKVKNAAVNPDQAIQLMNVRYHLRIVPPGIAKLVVPEKTIGTVPGKNENDEVAEMFLTLKPNNDRLLEGETQTLTLKGKALAKGTTQLIFNVHVDPDLNYLFPKNEITNDDTANVNVKD